MNYYQYLIHVVNREHWFGMEQEKNKTVYFVRHAQSEGNEQPDYFQSPASKLSQEGERQAKMLADRVSKIDIDIILSSSWPRARQTAEAIAKKIGKQICYSDLFCEAKLPSIYYGKRKDDPEIMKLQQLYEQNRFNQSWRIADEENFEDRKERAKKILDLLLSFAEENLLVVTHGSILRTVIAYMIFGEDFMRVEYHKFVPFLHASNIGITVCTHNENNGWKMITWNDRAHFG